LKCLMIVGVVFTMVRRILVDLECAKTSSLRARERALVSKAEEGSRCQIISPLTYTLGVACGWMGEAPVVSQ